MKQTLTILVLLAILWSCDKNDPLIEDDFEFVEEYTTTITIGGIVGIQERTFAVGETFEGTDDGGDIITIRIAEPSELNSDCPNPSCYQELLDVPREFLRIAD